MEISRAAIAFGLALGSSAIMTGAQTLSSGKERTWTTVAETVTQGANPSRTTDFYRQSGNTSFHEKRVEVLAPGGGYELYSDTETETVQDNRSTTRTVRNYSRGVDGQRQLTQLAEEQKQHMPGKEITIRTLSTPDEYGNQQRVQQEVVETTQNGSESQTHSTVSRADATGTLSAVTKAVETRNPGRSGTAKRIVQNRDLSGAWQVTEEVNATEQTDAHNQTVTDEITSRPDFEGNMSEVFRSVTKQSQSQGEELTTTDKYSVDVPGSPRDGKLHLVEQTTTSEQSFAGQKTITNTLKQPGFGGSGERDFTTAMIAVDQIDAATGMVAAATTWVRNLDGSLSLSSQENIEPNQIPFQVQMSAADQLK